jgi:hypothetical protein
MVQRCSHPNSLNEIIHRTRQLTVPVVAAAFGAAIAAFAAKPAGHLTFEAFNLSVPIAPPLVFLGWIFLLIGFLMDRLYYYKLLLAAVAVGEQLERTYDLPAKLTLTLSKAVSRRHAGTVVNLFYIGGFIIGCILLIVLALAPKDAQSRDIAFPSDATIYTLYRNSVVMENARFHVATFNSTESERYNNENCLTARDLFQQQPGVKITFWCEKGSFHP